MKNSATPHLISLCINFRRKIMDIFRQAKAELNSAERAISLRKTAENFDEFEDAWKSFLQ